MKRTLWGLLRLTRPANLPTAMADILAGLAIAGLFGPGYDSILPPDTLLLPVLFLLLASVFLYAGGVVLNDVFDAGLDRIERPERPIPSGVVGIRMAAVFGSVLLLLGICWAFLAHPYSGFIALLLAVMIVLYDAFFKRFTLLGPLAMGSCRGLNLALGMSGLGSSFPWEYAAIPLIYIFAITLISRGEVHGDNKKHIRWAAFLYALVIFGVVYSMSMYPAQRIQSLLFLAFFALMVYAPLWKAYQDNSAGNIKKAVMAGVLSLILLDASLAVIFTPWWYGFIILLLWPVSRMLSKIVAVT